MFNSLFLNLKYNYQTLDDSTLIITGYSGSDTELEIPSQIRRMKVTGIGNRAFFGRKDLKSIVILDGVTCIGDQAFDGCENLRSVLLPNSVTKIGAKAFSGCNNLKTINIPDGVTSIGDHAFSDCGSLIDILFPDSVVEMGELMFENCPNLGSVMVTNPSGVYYNLDIKNLEKNLDSNKRRYVCPYCGAEIGEKEVLFWESAKSIYTDNIRGSFLRHHGVRVCAGNIFLRMYYRVHSGNIISTDESGFPTMIRDCLKNAFEPEKTKNFRLYSFSSADLFDNDSFDINDNELLFEEDQDDFYEEHDLQKNDSFDDDLECMHKDPDSIPHNIVQRACPYCHCALPQMFGMLDTYHIAVYGGNASGKTAFLLNLLSQTEKQMSAHNLGNIELEIESENYFQPLQEEYGIYGTTSTTPKDGVLPIVCHYHNDKKEAYIIFHDIPSEGSADPEYLANHVWIPECETLFLMIDPFMFSTNFLRANKHMNTDCCTESLENLLYNTQTLLKYGCKIKAVIALVTKLDILFQYAAPHSSHMMNATELNSIKDAHRGGVNSKHIISLSKCLEAYMNDCCHVKLGKEIREALGADIDICILGAASCPKEDVDKEKNLFMSHADLYAGNQQIIDSFLLTLKRLNLVPEKAETNCIIWHIRQFNEMNAFLQNGAPQLLKTLTELFPHPEEKVQENDQSVSSDFDF